MRIWVAAAVALSLSVACYGTGRASSCGGTSATFGMPLGIVGKGGASHPKLRSLESIAAIRRLSDNAIAGWLALDDLGESWVQFGPDATGLRHALAGRAIHLGGKGIFSPLKMPWYGLPAGYQLEACAFIDAHTRQ